MINRPPLLAEGDPRLDNMSGYGRYGVDNVRSGQHIGCQEVVP